MIKNIHLRRLWLILIASGFLNGCEQNQPNSGLPTQVVNKKYTTATTLHGSITDNKGIVSNGTVKVTSVGGQLIASVTLQNSKEYAVEIPADTALPLLLNFSAEAKNTEEKFVAVVIHPSITQYDINPLTTAIAKKAMSLGGYTDANMRQAAESSSSVQSANNLSTVDQTKAAQHYGGWH